MCEQWRLWIGGLFAYIRCNQLGYLLVQDPIPSRGILILDHQSLQKRMRSAQKRLSLIFTPIRMFIIREGLNIKQMPRRKRVKHIPLPRRLSPASADARLRRFTSQREGQHGATLGNVDVVLGFLIRGALVEFFPGGGLVVLAHYGVVFEDEEEAAVADVRVSHCEGMCADSDSGWGWGGLADDGLGGEGAVHVGGCFVCVALGGDEMGEEFVHVEVFGHGEVEGAEDEGRGLLDDSMIFSKLGS